MSPDRTRELQQFVNGCTYEEGGQILRIVAHRLDEVREPAAALTPEERTMTPLDAVKSIRNRLGVSLATAKAIWDRR